MTSVPTVIAWLISTYPDSPATRCMLQKIKANAHAPRCVSFNRLDSRITSCIMAQRHASSYPAVRACESQSPPWRPMPCPSFGPTALFWSRTKMVNATCFKRIVCSSCALVTALDPSPPLRCGGLESSARNQATLAACCEFLLREYKSTSSNQHET